MAHCPFYLIVGIFIDTREESIKHNGGSTTIHSAEIDTSEGSQEDRNLDLEDSNLIADYICNQVRLERKTLAAVMVIKNSTVGGPRILNMWVSP